MIKVFECFAGYGGASWGLKLANIKYECIGYSEIKKSAIKCFNNNFPNIKNYGDITKINWDEVPDFDLLTGGFPCQDVSIAGDRDLSKGRTILVNELLKILKIKKPKYFLFENVTGIQSKKFYEFLFYINNSINRLGYDLYFKKLQSCDYGTPNYRTRVWFIGYRKNIAPKFGFNPYPNDKNKTDFLVIKDILEKRIDEKYIIKNTNIIKDINKRREKKILNLGQWKYSPYKSEYNLFSIYGLSPTLFKSTYGFLINDKLYKMTEREAFRVMGFLNDEINLKDLNYNECMDLTTNGWDVNLVSKIFKNMKMK